MKPPLRVLHLEDDRDYSELVRSMLESEGYATELVCAMTQAEFREQLTQGEFDLIIADYLLPDFNGLRALKIAKEVKPEIPFLLVSGTIGEEAAISSLKEGASDYVLKNWPERLMPAVNRVLRESSERKKRKEAETTLARREKYFRTLTENALDIVTILNREGIFLYNSPSVEHVLGYRSEELVGQSAFALVHPDDLARVLKTFEHAIAHPHETPTLDFRFKHKDGAWRYLEAVGRSLLDDSEIAGVVVNSRDITERRWVEHNHAAFSKLGQRLSSATTQKDAAQIITDVADYLFGWDACTFDLVSPDHKTVLSILNIDTIGGRRVNVPPKEEHTIPSPRTERVLTEGPVLILREETSSVTRDAFMFGDESRPSASIMAVPVSDGATVLGLLSVQSYEFRAYTQRDLSALQALADHCGGALQRIRTQEALKRSEQRLKAVWENSVDGMRLIDQDGVIVAVNDAFCKLVGLPREELEGKPFTATYALEGQQEDSLSPFRERFAQRTVELHQQRHLTFRSGKAGEFDVTSSYVELPGQESLLLSLFHDLTEQKRLETQLRHAQKMDAIGQLAGGVAHDFNNLLTIIQGHASLLLNGGELPSKLVESVQLIGRATERATSLTRQLLTFSRRQIIQRKRFDLNEVVTQITKMLSRILGEDIALEIRPCPQTLVVEADVGMMEQIIMNLSVNARDAMPRGGRLSIETSLREIDAQYVRLRPDARPGTFVCLSLSDTGIGIAPEHLPRIFEPFFTTKATGKGTGLGLSTVYGIVKIHEGWIELASSAGQGTTFRIYIPVSHGPVDTIHEPPQQTARGGSETILLAEDETAVRNLVLSVLVRHGYQVIAAPSGVEALDLWQLHKDKIDLLLTDMVMPGGVTGRELAERVLADRPDLKVLYTSGYSSEVAGKDFILREGSNFLQKPFHPQKLARTIRECLDGKSV